MTISFVVAASENNAIGKDNQLLWHLPNDMRFFKNTTWGSVVIMGRKSFESMGKALKGRINIVITRQQDWKAEDVVVASDLQDALKKAEAANCKEIFIIGGGEIYRQSLDIADKIYLTRVHTTIEGDTFFPELDKSKWELISNEDFKKDEKHLYDYSFQILERK
ncbi:dihydrofolate reductase [Ferruginibacter sp. SUN002]|uniref:dihydrofolate reductase n=1 Tax=Ferruginibacter sp. SUN002 TaxID=2937789 RepID=UPI003D35DBE0